MTKRIELGEADGSAGRMWLEAIVGTIMIFALLVAMLLILPDQAPRQESAAAFPKPVIVTR